MHECCCFRRLQVWECRRSSGDVGLVWRRHLMLCLRSGSQTVTGPTTGWPGRENINEGIVTKRGSLEVCLSLWLPSTYPPQAPQMSTRDHLSGFRATGAADMYVLWPTQCRAMVRGSGSATQTLIKHHLMRHPGFHQVPVQPVD